MSETSIALQPPRELTTFDSVEPPVIISHSGANARFAYAEFLGDSLRSDFTRIAYRHAIDRFLMWCEAEGFELVRIPPGAVGHYVRNLTTSKGEPASNPTKKLHLAAIRKCFDNMVQRHAVVINPASTVRGPVVRNVTGKTPATDPAQARALLHSIDTTTLIGLRDRAILATLMYTACRVGAVSKLRLRDFFTDGRQFYLRFDEKGGLDRQIPCRHDLQGFIDDYLVAARIVDGPLFRTALGRTLQLSERPCEAKDIHRMVKRRLKAAGLPSILTCHSFRATTATDLLEQGLSLEDVQELLGHADPRTTRLYDRRDRIVTRNVVERISI